ncbi:MAG: RnfABCDGE type electron transport complex subunit G, partial [Pseudomonadales bacterium]|nr:RnfABCDGE type electron transport complex subunit G [Pseudomonadales bacterium]
AGYNGLIQLIMAVDLQGRVLGVRVTRHQETPGLGDKIEPQLSDWIHRFEGRSLEDPEVAGWTVRKNGGDFDQFTGATITPRAVVHAVRDRLLALQKQADISGAPQ